LAIDGGGRYPALDLSPRIRMERTLAALLSQLVSLSTHQPVLMTFEDAHWIDPSSMFEGDCGYRRLFEQLDLLTSLVYLRLRRGDR
jgi:hypothetical protein